jgi:hypothetical protein
MLKNYYDDENKLNENSRKSINKIFCPRIS